jgi:hypothetical protein
LKGAGDKFRKVVAQLAQFEFGDYECLEDEAA